MIDLRILGSAFVVLALSLARPGTASAQDDEARRGEAQRLFDAAVAAMEQKDYAAACPKLAEVVRLQPGKVGAMLTLAECHEGAGNLASAWSAYRTAGTAAVSSGDRRASKATAKVAELAPKVPQLIVDAPRDVRALPGFAVRRNGRALEPDKIGKPEPVDPGEYEISAQAAGKKPWVKKIMALAGSPARVEIRGLDDEDAAPSAARAVAPPRDAPSPPKEGEGIPWWAWSAGGVGVAATAVAIVFLADQTSAQSSFDASCKTENANVTACDAMGARVQRDFGLWVGLGAAGLVGLGVATFGIVRAVRAKPAGVSVAPRFTAGPRGGAAGLEVRF
jgi:hypothetical protein